MSQRFFLNSARALLACIALVGCTTPPQNNDASTDNPTASDVPTTADVQADGANATDVVETADGADGGNNDNDCDPLNEGHCAYPWPSNLYLTPDPARVTGFTLNFGRTSLPRTNSGAPADGSLWRRFDGYSVGETGLVLFPNLDASTFATEYSMSRSMAMDAPILFFEVTRNGMSETLTRIPYWAELDSREPDATKKTLFIRPGVVLKENTRYVIALRNLRTTMGSAIEPSAAFRALRDRTAMDNPRLAPRVARFETMFNQLDAAGVARNTLTLAWDFNTASQQAISGRLNAMVTDALRQMPEGPVLTLMPPTVFTEAENADIAMEYRGTFEAPMYLEDRVIRSLVSTLLRDGPNNTPMSDGTRTVDFWIRIPRSAVRSAGNPNPAPHGLVQYGHGLMGGGDEVRAGYNDYIANHNNLIFFSASLLGMSTEDFVTVGQVLRDFSRFPFISDRLQQGMVEWILLMRAMHRRFPTMAEPMMRGIQVNRDERFYSGISQGGIFGATYVAISPDITRGHFGVPGINYSTLLQRSRDFNLYFNTLRMSYSDTRDHAVLLSLAEIFWAQVDPVSYVRHVTSDPFPGLPRHYGLWAPAKGDHQVSPVTDEVMARSGFDIPVMTPYEFGPMGQAPELAMTGTYPRRGSGVVVWDLGNPWQTAGNRTVSDAEDMMFPDPHGRPRKMHQWHTRQMVHFFRGRPQNEAPEIIDVCNGQACAFTNCFGDVAQCMPRF